MPKKRKTTADRREANAAACRRWYQAHREYVLDRKAKIRGGGRRPELGAAPKPRAELSDRAIEELRDRAAERTFRRAAASRRSATAAAAIAEGLRITRSAQTHIPGDDNRSAEELLADYEKDGEATLRRIRER